MKRSVLYNISKLEEKVVGLHASQGQGNNLTDLQRKLGLSQPIMDLRSFFEFDNKLKSEKNFADSLVIFCLFILKILNQILFSD